MRWTRLLVARVIRAFKVDKVLKATGAEEPLSKAGFRLDSGAFIGGLVKWFLLIVFLMTSLEVVGLSTATSGINLVLKGIFLDSILRVIWATLILVVAAFLAPTLQRVVLGSAKAAGVYNANLLGGVAKWAVWVFAVFQALFYLGVVGAIADSLIIGLIAMLSLAGGLAFGLGGKDAAAQYIEKLKSDIKNH